MASNAYTLKKSEEFVNLAFGVLLMARYVLSPYEKPGVPTTKVSLNIILHSYSFGSVEKNALYIWPKKRLEAVMQKKKAVNPVVNDLGTEDVGFPNRKKFMKLFNTGPEKNVTGIKMNLTLENCADACLKMETCKSFMAHDNTTECILYETWSGEIRYQSLKEENYYYYQKILDEKCPINVFYGGMFRDNEVMSKYKMTTYVECLKNCGKSTKCYSTNYDVSTAACYLIARNSTGIAIRRHYTNWIGTEVDRDKFDNDPNVLRDLNEKGCDLKFLYVLNVIDERTYPSDDTMRRGVLFSKRQNTSVLNILLKAQGTVAEANFPSTSKFMKVSKTRPPKYIKWTEKKIPLENCADTCLKMQTCKSFTYYKQRSHCRLYETWSGEIRMAHARKQ
ncbi:uncharacterized protein LOC106868212 [Octopus bimaculoides]|uniref:uncharacterized protein LOC106868212 n=1 Tax=Octopus bimaculoides TaxID=37653 RepID=UPI0022E972BD|nr:uncharacterized protein LOC106868212 [Octopus bimaculoides]